MRNLVRKTHTGKEYNNQMIIYIGYIKESLPLILANP
jgi:hypothetical protein